MISPAFCAENSCIDVLYGLSVFVQPNTPHLTFIQALLNDSHPGVDL